ncbi:MAG: hypothetical protein U1F98_10935 [Verrucomicrobiota bacterium]
MQTRMEQAQQDLADARQKGDAETQAAMKRLQDLQAAQAEKLRAITAKSQATVDAFKKMKAGL